MSYEDLLGQIYAELPHLKDQLKALAANIG